MASIALVRRSFRIDGGAERSIVNYIASYLKAGHRVVLICERWSGVLPSGVEIIQVRLFGGRLLKLWLFWFYVQRIMDKGEFEIVQAHEWIARTNVMRLGDGLHSVWMETLVRERRGLSRYLTQFSWFHLSKCWMEKKSLSSASLSTIIVNSNFIASQLFKRYPFLRAKVVVHRNVIDRIFTKTPPVKSKFQERELRLLFVGSGWARKGLYKAIEVIDSLRHVRSCSLTIYGTDKKSISYVKYVISKGLGDFVHFAGVVPIDSELYSRHDILILPTAYDPFPNVIAEALSVGLAVLTSSNSGAVDFKDSSQVLIADTHEDSVSRLASFSSSCIDCYAVNEFRNIFSQSAFEAALTRDGLS